jgi:hypothetical protein
MAPMKKKAMKAMMSMKASSKAMKAMKDGSKCKGRTKEVMPRVTASELKKLRKQGVDVQKFADLQKADFILSLG